MSDVRKQVMAQIVAFMARAEAGGMDPYRAAKHAFPGTPASVLGEACAELDHEHTEAWWQSIEKTIDGEVITRALAMPAGKP